MSVVLVVLGLGVAGAAGASLRDVVLRAAAASGVIAHARAVAGVNLTGAILLALLQVLPVGEVVRTVLGVGFCGALSTFSTWMLAAYLRVEVGASWCRVVTLDLAAQLVVGVLLVVTVLRVV